jgi:hypothetical protein
MNDQLRISQVARIAQLEAALRTAGVPVPPWGIERSATIRANFRSGRRQKDLAKKLGVTAGRANQLEAKWFNSLSPADQADCCRARWEAKGVAPDRIEKLLEQFREAP